MLSICFKKTQPDPQTQSFALACGTVMLKEQSACYHFSPDCFCLSGTRQPVSGTGPPLMKLHKSSESVCWLSSARVHPCAQLATRSEILHALRGLLKMPRSTSQAKLPLIVWRTSSALPARVDVIHADLRAEFYWTRLQNKHTGFREKLN